jgi:hypothetical protein
MKTANERSPWITASWVLAATLLAATIAAADIIPDFVDRVRMALNGEKGEGADWGQPLFFMGAVGAIPGMIAGVVTYGVIVVIKRVKRGQSGRMPD